MDFEHKYQKDPGMNRVKNQFSMRCKCHELRMSAFIFLNLLQEHIFRDISPSILFKIQVS